MERLGCYEVTVRLLAAADMQYKHHGVTPPWIYVTGREKSLSAAFNHMSRNNFDAVWRHGQTMPIDEAIADALEIAKRYLLARPRD
jgi:hypothetical protein